MGLKRKLKSSLARFLECVENHSEYIRYMWPDKEISTMFKVLNLISADWLRLDINSIRGDLYLINLVLDSFFDKNGNMYRDINIQVYEGAIKRIKHLVDRTEKDVFEVFQI